MEKMGMREFGTVMFYEDEYDQRQNKNGEEEYDFDYDLINELFGK